jgi:iron complex outermembrane receptor protein
MCFALLGSAIAQQSVSGTVVSESDGLGLPGVTVSEKGTGNGALTDSDGKYSIKVSSGKATLVFSFIGMKTVEEPVNNRTSVSVKMKSDDIGLDEVVVTALGIKRDRKALGYSMSSLKADDLVKAGTPINPLSSLYGKAAGVRVSSTAGGPSAGMVLNIRNSVSLNEGSNTRPLIVVDGIPIFDENTSLTASDRHGRDRGTGINDINAADIESMDILKGAKAAVLYGSAGANGVILITTKSGSKKKGFGIESSVSYTWENVAFLPEMQNEFGTGGNVAYTNRDPQMVDEDGFLYTMVNGTKTKTYFNASSSSFGPKMDGSNILWWNGEMLPYTPQPDNYKDLFQQGHLRTANVVMSNAGDLGSYRVSYTAKDYDGIQLRSSQQNHNFSVNGNINISDRIKLTTVSNYYYSFNRNAPYHMQDGFVTYGIRRDMKSELWLNNIVDEAGYWYFRDNALAQKVGALAGGVGMEYLWNQTQNDNDETKHHFIQSADLNIELTDWLSFKVLTGFDMTRKMLEVKKKVTKPIAENPFQGYYSVAERNILNFYTQAHFNLDTKINDDLNLTALLGGVYRKNNDRNIESITEDFLVENWFTLGNSSRSVKSQGSGYRGSDVLYSVLGSAQLAYKEYLYLELQARNDWSSILPPSNNNYFYPGASLSWIASQSLTLPEVIQFAKARLSWADVGRPGPRYFGNMAYNINSYGGIPYATTNGEIPPVDFANANGKLPEENLKPERKREFEFGLEMNFFKNNRLGFDFSAYRSNSYNEIIALQVPASSGASKVRTNAGDIQHTGLELQLKGKPILTSNFQWETILNIASDKTKINKLANGIEILPLWGVTGAKIEARVGGEYGEIYVNPYKTNDKGERIVGSSGLYETDKDNLKLVGKSVPDFTGGFSNNFTYKRFTLGIDADFQFGGTLISQTNMYLKGNGTGKESLQYRDEARGGFPYYVNTKGEFISVASHTSTVPADAKYNFIFHDGVILPGVKADGTKNDKLICAEEYYGRTFWNGDMAVSEDAIYKSDYISLRRITLSYSIPDQLTRKMGIYNAQISAFGSNLAYIYKALPNVTPESTMGTNYFTEQSAASAVRMFGVELKLAF